MKISAVFLLLVILLTGTGCNWEQDNEFYLFVGTYTDEASEGIYLYRFDAATGSVDSVGLAAATENPSYLALSPGHSFLYAVNELGDSADATVSSFAFEREEERLDFLNSRSSRGGAPCYISVDQGGETVFAGNYAGGSLAMFPVNGDGSLAEAKATVQHEGGSVNENRQENPHVHCTLVSPDNSWLLAADLGTDRVTAYAYDHMERTLERDPSSVYEAEPGAGPRHLTFHPDGKRAYLINELNGTIAVFDYSEGALNEVQTVSTLPPDYEGAVSGADIHLSPDGRFLYASNREELNDIVIYSVDPENGQLEEAGRQSTGGVHPRNFTIDPTGRYLLAANRNSDNITIFERNGETGMLSPTGEEIGISQPVCLKMVPVQEPDPE